jgi:FKBP-type peptidyl-prolyl cis-trans isomerase FkpA
MKNSFLLSVCVAALLMACSKTKETPSGLKFTVVKSGGADVAENGQVLIFNYLFKDGKDSVWADSRTNPFPTMTKKDSLMGSDPVMEVVQMLGKGDSVTFQIPAKQLFEKSFRSPIPAGVDSASNFTFQIGLTDVVTEERAREMQTEFMAKQNEEALMAEKEQLAKDTLAIDLFLKEKAIVAQKTASGLRYVFSKPGMGANAQGGQQVKVNYIGTLLDGTFFDSSIEAVAKANNAYNEQRAPYEPLQLTLGTQSVIPGWEEALTLMNKGSKMTVYIPSTLAYGNRRRSDVIAENSILVFEMELVDIIK